MKGKILQLIYSLQNLFFKVLNYIGFGSFLFYLPKSYLRKKGWFKSWRAWSSIDSEGQAIPWLTYPCINFLEKRINSNMNIFEYGSGNSTLWWARQVKQVVSCEHESKWYRKMKELIKHSNNVKLFCVNLDSGYSKKISEYKSYFDIAVLDGRERVECAYNTIEALKDDGVIVWDNSDRIKYHEGFEYLKSKGFKRLELEGLGPLNFRGSQTSIFYRKNNCLGI